MVRIPEQHDWVIFCILGCIFLYIFSFNVIYRNATIKDFLTIQKEEASNIVLSWMLTSFVFCIMLAVNLSQFLPATPQFLSEYTLYGYKLNKIGFTVLSLFSFYFVKNLLTYIYYSTLGYNKLLINLYLIANKLYFLGSLVLMASSFAFFFFPIDSVYFLYILFGLCLFMFITKLISYFFNTTKTLPFEWYYKILYICTLQIVPLLVLTKFLFY